MKITVKVYDGIKYSTESNVVYRGEQEIESFEVKTIPAEEILKEFDTTDEYNEYLILKFKDGETATYRNSYVDIFRA